MTDISVVIPAWRAAGTVGAAVASVLAQGDVSLEALVVDDGGDDGTAAAAIAAAAGDSRLRVLRRRANGGPAAARNTGFDAAGGEWIAILDADDMFLRGRLAALLALARRTGADLVSDNIEVREEDCPPYVVLPPGLPVDGFQLDIAGFVAGNLHEQPGRRTSYGHMQPMFRRRFLRSHRLRHDERNRFGEDYMFYLACLAAGGRWWVTPDVFYRYAVRGGSLTEVQCSGDLWRIAAFERKLLRHPSVIRDRAAQEALRQHVAKVERLYAYRAFTDAVKAGQASAAARVLTEAPVRPFQITQELARQTPSIVRKALRGGYRQ